MSNLFPSSQHPYLLYSKEVSKALQEDKRIIRDSKLLRKIANALDDLNDHGTNPEYHSQGNLEPLGKGWWSLRIRHQNDYWRIMFRKADSKKYGLAIMFLKKKTKSHRRNGKLQKELQKEKDGFKPPSSTNSETKHLISNNIKEN